MEKKPGNKRKSIKNNIQKDEQPVNGFVQTYKSDDVKMKLIERLQFHLGNIKKACDDVGINRTTYYKWHENDPYFRQQVEDISEGCIDLVESELLKQIKDGNVTAMIFYLKTKGKKRGYIERAEIDVTQQTTPDLSGLTSEEIIEILKLSENGAE